MTNASSLRSPLLPFLLALMGVMASCVFPRDHGDRCEDRSHSCHDTLDCHDNQFCRRGLCRDLPSDVQTCATSEQCGWRQSCIDGVCNQSCSRHSDCPNGGRCDNGFCEGSSSGSFDAGSPWTRVDAGTPRPDAGTPRPDAGTPTPDAGTCANPGDAGTPPPQSTCRDSADCGAGNFCISAVCHQGCSQNVDCPDSDICEQGVCRPRPVPVPACFSNLDCPTAHDCVDGACRMPCASSAECSANALCRSGYCVDAQSDPGSGQVCQSRCECPSGERCIEGRCRL